ncbi:histidine kinase [Nocardia sp. NPDC127526]|uniref:histidine kinase n=1 Tax=Nocardia sp. NPDC127526 TaxID=3345393 RepID=UPI0036304F71
MNRVWWIDGLLMGLVLLAELVASFLIPASEQINGSGIALLVSATLPLIARRRYPMAVLITHTALAIPYHANEFPHEAIIPSTILALYTVARHGNRRRTAGVILAVMALAAGGILFSRTANENTALQTFGAVGWIVLACVAGEAVRLHRAYIAEVLDRAERAERTRDEEARRQVTEERLRIARDLHDLLAHTITVIQVQAGVAAHLLTERHADSRTVIDALETISDACADARAELAATVGVLRAPSGGARETDASREPLPDLTRVRALAEHAEAAGVTVEFVTAGHQRPLAPTVELVGYRIIQEALTNIAKHAQATIATVRLDYRTDRLLIGITDNGRGRQHGDPGNSMATTGFGIRGMIERATAIGGTVSATDTGGGFEIAAALPVSGHSSPTPAPIPPNKPVAAPIPPNMPEGAPTPAGEPEATPIPTSEPEAARIPASEPESAVYDSAARLVDRAERTAPHPATDASMEARP